MQWQENRIETNNTVEDVRKHWFCSWKNHTYAVRTLLEFHTRRVSGKKHLLFQGAWSPVSLEFLNDLWIPNVFIYNLKSFHSIEVLKRLAGESISRLLWSWNYNFIPMLMIPAEQLWVPVIKTCCSIVSCIDANNKIDSVTISPQFVPKIFWNTIKCSKIIFFLYLKVSG